MNRISTTIAAYRYLLLSALLLQSVFSNVQGQEGGDQQRERWVGGWLTYWQFEQGLASINQTTNTYQEIYFFIGQLSTDGTPLIVRSKHNFRATVQQLKAAGQRAWLTVVNDVVSPSQRPILKDPYTVSRMLSTPQTRQRHIDQLTALAKDYGFYGIDIDYESLRYRDRNNFSLFIEELAQALQAQNIKLAVTVQPKTTAKRSNGAGVNDWPRLCRVVDRLQIMLYNEHSGKTGPGPIASTAWMERVLDYAETKCPINTIVPSIKVLGATWHEKGVRGITHQNALSLARQHGASIERTDQDLIPHFTINRANQSSTTYYEDEQSIGIKLAHLKERGYNHIVLWRLGSYDPEIDKKLLEFRANRNRIGP